MFAYFVVQAQPPRRERQVQDQQVGRLAVQEHRKEHKQGEAEIGTLAIDTPVPSMLLETDMMGPQVILDCSRYKERELLRWEDIQEYCLHTVIRLQQSDHSRGCSPDSDHHIRWGQWEPRSLRR